MMNIAVPFMRGFKYFDDPNVQLNINYKPKIKELDDFFAAYGKDHRINVLVRGFDKERDFAIIKTLLEKYPDYQIIIGMLAYDAWIEDALNEEQIPHYYNEFVTTWDKFQGFLSLNVTDIFVAEELAFSAKILSKNTKENGKSLRAFCNVCQSSWDETPSFKTFFVRPEDLAFYEGIIDTFEFYINDTDATKVNALYELYTKDRKWYGKLSEIIVGYEGDEDSRFLLPHFGKVRVDCGKVCNQDKTECFTCERIQAIEQALRKRKIAVSLENL